MLIPHAKHIRMPREMMADPVAMSMRRSPDHPTLAPLIPRNMNSQNNNSPNKALQVMAH